MAVDPGLLQRGDGRIGRGFALELRLVEGKPSSCAQVIMRRCSGRFWARSKMSPTNSGTASGRNSTARKNSAPSAATTPRKSVSLSPKCAYRRSLLALAARAMRSMRAPANPYCANSARSGEDFAAQLSGRPHTVIIGGRTGSFVRVVGAQGKPKETL